MKAPTYKKLDPISHIHHRPDMYLGSVERRPQKEEWMTNKFPCDDDTTTIVLQQDVVYSDGLLRIFIEALSNAIDNVWRSKQAGVRATKIRVSIDRDTGRTSIWNDGLHIPIEVHEEEKIYNPELIFGHLLSGSNLDDTEERLSSGRNGLGIKLVNVFSKEFEIDCIDPDKKLRYRQKWTNNMRKCGEPKIASNKNGSGATQITWIPDFERFGYTTGYDDTILRLYSKYTMDASMVTGISIYLNDTKFNFSKFSDYCRLYPVEPFVVSEMENGTKIMIGLSRDEHFHEIGFVNGIMNRDGGVHCDAVTTEMADRVCTKWSGKNKVTWKDIRMYFTIIVNTWLPNPRFNSQSKTKLIQPSFPFKMETRVLNTIMKWSFVENVNDMLKQRELQTLKKTEKKGKSFRRIDGLDPANLAGTRHASDCVLVLCEGLSAKTYATNGINVGWNGKKGRSYFGIMPLRGKCLNVRNATMKAISENKEITDIIQTLNLRYQTDYSDDDNWKTLRYGKVLIITDADEDGHHICSLIINFFHKLFPSILKRDPCFLNIMMTPIAKITFDRKTIITYYSDFAYQKALQEKKKMLEVKYYKGLGTSSDQEIRDTFGQKVVGLKYDDDTDELLDKVFNKLSTQERKNWLTTYNPNSYTEPIDLYPISTYINQELIKFSLEDCRRSIPNLYDGLKVSQRKILFSVFKKNLVHSGKSMKVAQLAGYCAEQSNYHHGEQCLFETIIKMTHDFVGSNNIAYLYRDGQFGSRCYGGKDAANARYIFTKLGPLTRYLFPDEDDVLLTYTLDDGDRVEPDYYVPIIPMILVNGCSAGIGTGWSCSVPCFSVEEIVNAVRSWLQDPSSFVLDIDPYYRGFRGSIEKIDDKKYVTTGILKVSDKKPFKKDGGPMYEVTELPVQLWTNKFKEDLEQLLEDKKLVQMHNYSTPNDVNFVFQTSSSFTPTVENLKMQTTLHISNMVLFTKEDRLQKYDNIKKIFETYAVERLALYEKRKAHLLKTMDHQLRVMTNKMRFISEIYSNELHIFRLPEDKMNEILNDKKYEKIEDGYQYLLNIPMRHFSSEKIMELKQKIDSLKKETRELRQTSPQQLWLKDLDVFMNHYKH